jgi:hypothetical protein
MTDTTNPGLFVKIIHVVLWLLFLHFLGELLYWIAERIVPRRADGTQSRLAIWFVMVTILFGSVAGIVAVSDHYSRYVSPTVQMSPAEARAYAIRRCAWDRGPAGDVTPPQYTEPPSRSSVVWVKWHCLSKTATFDMPPEYQTGERDIWAAPFPLARSLIPEYAFFSNDPATFMQPSYKTPNE